MAANEGALKAKKQLIVKRLAKSLANQRKLAA